MQVITHPYGKEIKSRNYRELRHLQTEYQRLGATTQINLFDACEHMWSLIVREKENAPLIEAY